MPDLTVEKIDVHVIEDDETALVVSDATTLICGRRIICSGADYDRDVAHAKMVSEIAERLAFLSGQREGLLGSTGFAAHPKTASAERAARLELVERSFNDRIRSNPEIVADLRLEYPDGAAWIYYLGEIGLVHAIAWRRFARTTGWGAAVDLEVGAAVARARQESLMMAASLLHYGHRGNALTAYEGAGGRIGQSILFEDRGVWRILGEERYVVRADWKCT